MYSIYAAACRLISALRPVCFCAVVTGTQLVVIVIILCAGFSKANPANLRPFMPFGVEGIFNGASFVFFSFIGFDCVSTLAEEVRREHIYTAGNMSPTANFMTCQSTHAVHRQPECSLVLFLDLSNSMLACKFLAGQLSVHDGISWLMLNTTHNQSIC